MRYDNNNFLTRRNEFLYDARHKNDGNFLRQLKKRLKSDI